MIVSNVNKHMEYELDIDNYEVIIENTLRKPTMTNQGDISNFGKKGEVGVGPSPTYHYQIGLFF
jgi:hypothetical protein